MFRDCDLRARRNLFQQFGQVRFCLVSTARIRKSNIRCSLFVRLESFLRLVSRPRGRVARPEERMAVACQPRPWLDQPAWSPGITADSRLERSLAPEPCRASAAIPRASPVPSQAFSVLPFRSGESYSWPVLGEEHAQHSNRRPSRLLHRIRNGSTCGPHGLST